MTPASAAQAAARLSTMATQTACEVDKSFKRTTKTPSITYSFFTTTINKRLRCLCTRALIRPKEWCRLFSSSFIQFEVFCRTRVTDHRRYCG
ncbi:hypothetical protein J6590_046072 [Homalodisca vitripennis]|nr:hypothetical protein J6590_046072 [Homalodisca vitripennis]